MRTYKPYYGSSLARRLHKRRVPAPSPDDLCLLSSDGLLNIEQMLINEALVAKIFQCEHAAAAMSASEKKLNDLLEHQVATREEERRRIAHEIRDGLGQNLQALRMDISALHARTSATQPRLHGWVGTALDNLDSALHALGQIVAEMRPFQLELGLAAAVEWELDKFQRTCGMRSCLALDPRLGRIDLPDEHTLALYRALQECLNNVFRHSMASRVNVMLEIVDHAILMNVSDNGIGFDVDGPRKSSSYGLLGLQERMGALGGQLVVTSSHSHGTTVTLSLPFAPSRRRQG